MKIRNIHAMVMASTFLVGAFAEAHAQTAVVTFPSSSSTTTTTTPNLTTTTQNGGVGYYNSGQVYGNVQLCGAPPYVYPCAYGQQQVNPYAQNQQQQDPASAAQEQQTFGLGSQQSGAAGATFPLQQGRMVDQSPSTTTDGYGNTAGPILASPPAYAGTYDGGDYTRADIMNPNSSFYTSAGRSTNPKTSQIRNVAYQVGVKAGFAAEAQRINNSMLKYRYSMDQQFQFRQLMEAEGAVVPPVITTVTDIVERRSADYLYLTAGAYEIVQPAFVTVKVPAWQDYIELDGGGPVPPRGVQVKDKAEKVVWAEASRTGWQRGVTEARAQFTAGLSRLIRDYKGMQTYHRLAEMGAVNLTKVRITREGGAIYMNGRKAVGDTMTVQLVVQPKFKSTKKIVQAIESDRLKNTAPRNQ